MIILQSIASLLHEGVMSQVSDTEDRDSSQGQI